MSLGRGGKLFVPARRFGDGFVLLAGQVLLFFDLEHLGIVIVNSASATPLHIQQVRE